MPNNRFYLPSQFAEGDLVTLEGTEAHHLIKVHRTEVGERVELANGIGSLASCEVLTLNKKEVKLHILQVENKPAIPSFHMALALTKQPILEWAIEKCSELSVESLHLFPSEKSVRDALSENHWKRLEALTVAAMKQSGRLHLTRLEFHLSLKELLKRKEQKFFGSLAKGSPSLLKCEETRDCLFIVGPESGFTAKEEKLLKTSGAKGVSLGKNTLRAETAAIAAAALLSAKEI